MLADTWVVPEIEHQVTPCNHVCKVQIRQIEWQNHYKRGGVHYFWYKRMILPGLNFSKVTRSSSVGAQSTYALLFPWVQIFGLPKLQWHFRNGLKYLDHLQIILTYLIFYYMSACTWSCTFTGDPYFPTLVLQQSSAKLTFSSCLGRGVAAHLIALDSEFQNGYCCFP